jgi:hypothetical protein
MRRLLLSLLCSAVVYVGYVTSVVILYLIYKSDTQVLVKASKPLKLPDYILFNFFQIERVIHLNLRGIILAVTYIAINLFVFSIPFYVAATLYSRMKRRPKTEGKELPPTPPTFESIENANN